MGPCLSSNIKSEVRGVNLNQNEDFNIKNNGNSSEVEAGPLTTDTISSFVSGLAGLRSNGRVFFEPHLLLSLHSLLLDQIECVRKYVPVSDVTVFFKIASLFFFSLSSRAIGLSGHLIL